MTARRRGAQVLVLLFGTITAAALIANELARARDLRRRMVKAERVALAADSTALQSHLREVHLLLRLVSIDPEVSRFDARARDRLRVLYDSSPAVAAFADLIAVRRTLDGGQPFLELGPYSARDVTSPDRMSEEYETLYQQLATFAEHSQLPALVSGEVGWRTVRASATPTGKRGGQRVVLFAVPIRSPGGELAGMAAAAIPSHRILSMISPKNGWAATVFLRQGVEPLATGDVLPAQVRWLASHVPSDRASSTQPLFEYPNELGSAVPIWQPIHVNGAMDGWVARLIDPERSGWPGSSVWSLAAAFAVLALAGALAFTLRSIPRYPDERSRTHETLPVSKAVTAPAADQQTEANAAHRDVAHDLNNVLATILTVGRWLEAQIGPDHACHESVRDIVAAARRGGVLTRRLLGSAEPDHSASSTSSVAAVGREVGLLVIDDEAPLRAMVRAAFERAGYCVLEAGDGEEALTTFDTSGHRIDCALLDLELPNGDGRELLGKLRERSPDLAVVMVTGRVLGDEAESLVTAGAHAVLTKPVELEKLFAAVRDALQDAPPTRRMNR